MGEKENNNSLNESPVARWLRNAVLGATMADLPAMMTASGWRLNEKGDYVLDLQNDPRVKLLRDNLAAEGAGVMLGEFGIPAVYGLYNLGLRGLGKAGSNYARAKLISREMQNASTSNHTYSLNVGWGPKQTIKVTHATDSLEPLQLFFDKRWDVTHEGANPFGVWYLGKWGLPRTATTNSLPGKAEKAEKARKVFADRKYKHEGDLTLDKPMTTVGEVPDRSVLSYEAEKMGADGIIYNNVYDNGYDNNQVIFSFKTPEKTSISKQVKKHLYGGLVEAGASFIPIVGTYLSYQDFKKDPTMANLGWTLASGFGDVLQLTGLGYGIGSAIKGLKAANAARKSVQAVNNVRRATRMANQAKMLEYEEAGKRGFQGWKAAGVNLRNSDKKLEAATLVLKGEALQQAKNAGKGFTAAFTDPVDWAETIYKNKDGLQ